MEEQKSYASLIIGIIVVLLLIGSGIYFWIQSKPAPTPAAQEQPQAETPKQETYPPTIISVNLDALNKSGQLGSAVVKDENGKAKVTLTITGEPKGAIEPAHIHVGACPNPGAVKYPLNNVVEGKSETVLEVSTDELLKELPLSINVHKSAKDIKIYVACGNIKPEAGEKGQAPSAPVAAAAAATVSIKDFVFSPLEIHIKF